MITLDDFIKKYTNVGIDTDGAFGYQLNTPVFSLGFFASLYSIFKRYVSSKMNRFIFNLNYSSPFFSTLIPTNPFIARRIVNSKITISKIGRITTNSQIVPSIIKRITVNMIDIISTLSVEKKSMELFNFVVRKSLLYIKTISHFADAPFTAKIFENFKISVIKQNIKNTVFFTNNSIDFHTLIITGGSQ